MKKPYKPERVSTLIPYLTVREPAKMVKFYHDAFGFEIEETVANPEGHIVHAEIRYKDIVIMCGRQGEYDSKSQSPQSGGYICPISLYMYCEDVDSFYAHAIRAGAVSHVAPNDSFWGDRMCQIADPEGYLWSFATWLGTQG